MARLRGSKVRGLDRMLLSMRGRNYRLYIGAQIVSQCGLWMQIVAENWLVVRLTPSGLALGVTTGLQFIPLLLIGAYGGVLVDRFDRRLLLFSTQSAAGLLALILGLLTLAGVIHVWMIWLAALALGCVNSLDRPGQQVFTHELVGTDKVANAVALNNAVATAARAVGPGLGGLVLVWLGIGPCFLVNAFSYVAVLVALASIRPRDLHVDQRAGRARSQVREGLRHAWHTPQLRTVLVMLAVTSTLAMNFQVLLPLLTSQTFGQGGESYGLLMSAMGAGAVAGSLVAAAWSKPTVRRVAALSVVFGGSLVAVAGSPTLTIAFVTVGIMGVCFSLLLVASSSSLQLNAGEGIRGRVMALYTIVFLGTAPIGGPLVGGAAQLLGARWGFLIGAAGSTAAGLLGFAALRASAPKPLDLAH